LTVSLSACGSSSPKSAGTTTTTGSTSTTAPDAQASALANRADALCGAIRKATGDLSHAKLQSPTSISALTTDFGRLQSDASSVTKASGSSSHGHQLADVVGDVRKAVGTAESAASAVTSGQTGAASTDLRRATGDLQQAGRLASRTSFQGCSATS
ncbi:MAG TPA: hypothetical protein VKV25_00500, partial [Acidimicrobiales bacterium]|nr:hypothetical protein [Acidimicrobiales bacterium]